MDESGEIVVFESGGCPWKDHLMTLEEELQLSPPIKFALFADQNGKWRVQCVPIRLGSFENRSDFTTLCLIVQKNSNCSKPDMVSHPLYILYSEVICCIVFSKMSMKIFIYISTI